MTLKAVDFFPLGDVEKSNLALGIAHCYFVCITEGDWTDVVVDLWGLVETGDFWGAAWPEVDRGVQGNGDLVAIGPVEEVEVEVVLEVGGL